MHEEKVESKPPEERIGRSEEYQQKERDEEEFNNFDQFEDAANEAQQDKSQDRSEKQEGEQCKELKAQEESEDNHQQIKHQQPQKQQKYQPPANNELNQPQKFEQNVQSQFKVPQPQPQQPKIEIEQKIIKIQPIQPQPQQQPIQPPNPNQQPHILSSGQIKNHIVMKQAQKERLASTYSIFLKYNIEYNKTVSSYKLIIKNIHSQLLNKSNSRKDLQSALILHFDTYIKLNKQFYQRSYKTQKQQPSLSTNKLLNIKQELKEGYEGLFYVRKSLADQMRKLQNYIITYTIKSLNQAFQNYYKTQQIEERKQNQVVERYHTSEKTLEKLFITMQKLFKKGIKGEKMKEDIFIMVVKFINQQKQYRQNLIKYGKTIPQLKKTFIIAEKQLFSTLQRIVNQFKVQSRSVHAKKFQDFFSIKNYTEQVQKATYYEYLCTITDIDYIKSVLELQNRKQSIKFTDEHFLQYIELLFFDNLVGNKKQLSKGAISKTFPLFNNNEQLIHTISGNLIHYNRQLEEAKDKFEIKNLNVRLIGEGAIQLDEIVKGVIFSDNRTVRLKMKDNDRAQELICYLNEKDEINRKK